MTTRQRRRNSPVWHLLIATVIALSFAACETPTGPEAADPVVGDGNETQAPEDATDAPAADTEAIVFPMPWVLNGAWSPFFISLDKGYFAQEGLQVAIPRGFGSTDTVLRVQSGTAQFGYADSTSLITVRSQDPSTAVVTVAQVAQVNPLIVVYVEGRGVETPQDLEGKSWGGPPGAFDTEMYAGYLERVGVDPTSTHFTAMEAAAKLPALLAGSIDVMPASINSYPSFEAAAQESGLEVAYFPFSEVGLEAYSWGIVTRQETIDNDPELVRRFVSASLKGWMDALADPHQAVESMLKYAPEIDADISEAELFNTLPLALSSDVEAHGLGWSDQARWEQTVDETIEYMGLENRPDPATLYTNDFLPGLIPEKLGF